MAHILSVLILIGFTGVIGYSQDRASEYVSPLQAVPRGKAPKMQVQLLNPGETTKQYAVIFYQGDEFFSASGVCGEVSRDQRSLHRYRGAQWSYAWLV
jgi:hypothetical protein